MLDHGRLDGERCAGLQNQLVVGHVVLAAIGDAAVFESGAEALDRAVACLDARKRDAVEHAEGVDKAHGVCGGEVGVAHGLLDEGDGRVDAAWGVLALWNEQVARTIRYAQEAVAALIAIYRVVLCGFKFERGDRLPTAAELCVAKRVAIPAPSGAACRAARKAGSKQGCCSKAQRTQGACTGRVRGEGMAICR